MNTSHTLYPSYAVLPSPYPRTHSTDLTLVAASSAERFSGLFARGTTLGWGFPHLTKDVEGLAAELNFDEGLRASIVCGFRFACSSVCVSGRGKLCLLLL